MANTKSQEKRNRQNVKSEARNSQVKSSVRTAVKKIIKTSESKDPAVIDQMAGIYKDCQKTIDKAVSKGVMHKKTASRKKSRLAKKANAAAKKQA